MEYTINSLAKLAGITTRTLRYYDNIELLKPLKVTEAGYRVYGPEQVNALQQILFYKSLGFELSAVQRIIMSPEYERLPELKRQKKSLQEQRERLDLLIRNISKTIESEERGIEMTDKEKFEGFKQKLVEDNELNYGHEIREKYGDKTVDASNARMMNLTQKQYDAMQQLGAEINELLEQAVAHKESPKGEVGKRIAQKHKEWLGFTWAKYNREAHKGLGEMYVADERFTEYYDKNVPGCAQFLRDAISEHI